MASAPRLPDLAACSADELRTLVIGLLEANAKLEAAVAALAEENARLKGLKGRPQIKPSGMEKGTDPETGVAPGDGTTRKQRRRPRRKPGQPKSARLIVDNDLVVPFTPEPGWRFKGYKPYTVQDLVIEVRVVRYWRPFYLTAEGKIVVAPLPEDVSGHFGANLVRYLLSQHYQCRVTMPLLIPTRLDVDFFVNCELAAPSIFGRVSIWQREAGDGRCVGGHTVGPLGRGTSCAGKQE